MTTPSEQAYKDIYRALEGLETVISQHLAVQIADHLAREGFGKRDDNKPVVGTRIHGYANGYFGRDSYSCRTIEAVGSDWIVTRSDRGIVEQISHQDFRNIDNIDDRFHCHEGCD